MLSFAECSIMAPYSSIAKNILGLGGQVLAVEDVPLEGPPPTYRDLLHHGVALCQQDPRLNQTELIKWVDVLLEYANIRFLQRIWDHFIVILIFQKRKKPKRDSPKFDVNKTARKDPKKSNFPNWWRIYWKLLCLWTFCSGSFGWCQRIENYNMRSFNIFFWLPLTPSHYNFHVSIYNPVVLNFMYPYRHSLVVATVVLRTSWFLTISQQ